MFLHLLSLPNQVLTDSKTSLTHTEFLTIIIYVRGWGVCHATCVHTISLTCKDYYTL